jgi:hypothetical protein
MNATYTIESTFICTFIGSRERRGYNVLRDGVLVETFTSKRAALAYIKSVR